MNPQYDSNYFNDTSEEVLPTLLLIPFVLVIIAAKVVVLIILTLALSLIYGLGEVHPRSNKSK